MVNIRKFWCRGVPWGVVGCRGVISSTEKIMFKNIFEGKWQTGEVTSFPEK